MATPAAKMPSVGKADKPKPPWNRPGCNDCGASNINDVYTSKVDGSKVDEADVLQGAVYAMVDLLEASYDELIDNEALAARTQNHARTLAGLVDMWIARQSKDKKPEGKG